ncbi:MAG: hypothetical protein HOH95_11110 [Dehalococcoidia bacterium]|jgi:4-amino-4-deoxy-L-arabinose transferase-like glycosyltransferase|nr:hypothetical protein [Dehalococcoidia bacterium]
MIERHRRGATAFALLAITALAAFLRLFDLGRAGIGSFFYASAVRSMGESWHNFVYAAFDPAGTLNVDKPPLALWLQVLSTKIFGFEGWAIILPMALAGTAAVLLVFAGAKRSHGIGAGLVAALVLAIFPESVATARDSTMDALVLALVAAAAWLLVVAVEDRRPWLLVAWTALMGIVFNVKFFEGFILLPAATVYVAWSWRDQWRVLVAPVLVATAVGVAVSLAWVAFVELTPADDRPMVMNDQSNSELGLAFRYNGLERVLPSDVAIFVPVTGVPRTQGLVTAALNYGVGDRGLFRLTQASNGPLIGFGALIALGGLFVVALRRRDWLLHGPGLFWAGWLITGIVFFSASNRAAAHYTESYAPAIAVLAGVGIIEAWRARGRLSGLLLPIGVALLLGFALFTYDELPPFETRISAAAAVGLVAAFILALATQLPPLARVASVARPVAVAAILVVPLVTSLWITLDAPRGGQVTRPNPIDFAHADVAPPRERSVPAEAMASHVGQTLPDARYRFAVSSINDAGEAIAVSGASVLPIWNEYQRAPVVEPEELEQLIRDGQIPYIFLEGATTYTGLLRDLQVVISGQCFKSSASGLGRGWSVFNCDPSNNPTRTSP